MDRKEIIVTVAVSFYELIDGRRYTLNPSVTYERKYIHPENHTVIEDLKLDIENQLIERRKNLGWKYNEKKVKQ